MQFERNHNVEHLDNKKCNEKSSVYFSTRLLLLQIKLIIFLTLWHWTVMIPSSSVYNLEQFYRIVFVWPVFVYHQRFCRHTKNVKIATFIEIKLTLRCCAKETRFSVKIHIFTTIRHMAHLPTISINWNKFIYTMFIYRGASIIENVFYFASLSRCL